MTKKSCPISWEINQIKMDKISLTNSTYGTKTFYPCVEEEEPLPPLEYTEPVLEHEEEEEEEEEDEMAPVSRDINAQVLRSLSENTAQQRKRSEVGFSFILLSLFPAALYILIVALQIATIPFGLCKFESRNLETQLTLELKNCYFRSEKYYKIIDNVKSKIF